MTEAEERGHAGGDVDERAVTGERRTPRVLRSARDLAPVIAAVIAAVIVVAAVVEPTARLAPALLPGTTAAAPRERLPEVGGAVITRDSGGRIVRLGVTEGPVGTALLELAAASAEPPRGGATVLSSRTRSSQTASAAAASKATPVTTSTSSPAEPAGGSTETTTIRTTSNDDDRRRGRGDGEARRAQQAHRADDGANHGRDNRGPDRHGPSGHAGRRDAVPVHPEARGRGR